METTASRYIDKFADQTVALSCEVVIKLGLHLINPDISKQKTGR